MHKLDESIKSKTAELEDYEFRKQDQTAIRRILIDETGITGHGKEFMEALNVFCKITAYTHGHDPHEIMKVTGRREVYNYIMAQIDEPVERRNSLDRNISNLKTQLEELENERRGDGD